MGEAVDDNAVADDEGLAGKVVYSRPYYGTGYVLVRRKDGPRVRTLAELKGTKSQRLGTEAGSVADYHLRQRGYLRRLFRNQLATLKALNDSDIESASELQRDWAREKTIAGIGEIMSKHGGNIGTSLAWV